MVHMGLDDWLVQAGVPIKFVDAEQAICFQLFLLLLDMRECGVTDPRDKIFAVLKFVELFLPQGKKCAILPSYERHIHRPGHLHRCHGSSPQDASKFLDYQLCGGPFSSVI
jgi:hypothetical protein